MAKSRAALSSSPASAIRCAVYTRKSTEEGLDQEFNSLDAQYEACSAYIASQRHEGWTLAKERYDDGGFSGGTMERPALRRLIADVAAGKIQIIVLYKIDRLTRSLSDFAKIVEVLDGAGASFVSVTQSFNTTTSMGRLTLNMLLSFAQFEREVTAERIRDKVAASRAKGMWMGGTVPLGYQVQDRKLVVEEGDANTVRHIFHRYADLGSGSALIEELRERRIHTKAQHLSDGRIRGGGPFTPGGLFYLLKNRTYIGKVVHKGTAHPGEHDAIIDLALWDKVQTMIASNVVEYRSRSRSSNPSLLAGIIVDGMDRRMTPSHAAKGSKRYRYYITHRAHITDDQPAWRISAPDAEWAVTACLEQLLSDRNQVAEIVSIAGGEAQALGLAFDRAADAATNISNTYHRRALIGKLVHRVTVLGDELQVEVDRLAIEQLLGLPPSHHSEPLRQSVSLARVRIGKQVKLVLGDDPTLRNDALLKLVSQAHAAREMVLAQPDLSIKDIADAAGQCRRRLTRLLKLSWLAPSITQAILTGRQPLHLSATDLLTKKLPLDWAAQRKALGFE